MLDSDLAEIYGVDTKRLNEQVKRNLSRFPEDFSFQLTDNEWSTLKSQFATSIKGGKMKLPYAFTENGAVMLATILRSQTAIRASILVVKAFVRMNEFVSKNKELYEKIKLLEFKSDTHDKEIQVLFETIEKLMSPPTPALPPMKKVGYKRADEDD